MAHQVRRGAIQTLRAARRNSDQLVCLLTGRWRHKWCLLEHNMSVGAAGTQAGDTRNQRRTRVAHPRTQACIDHEGTGGQADLGVGHAEVQTGRQLTVLQRQHRLDERSHSRRFTSVSDVRFERADGAESNIISELTICLNQPRHFDWITNECARAVSLHVGHIAGVHPRHGQSFGHHSGLTTDAWRQVTNLVVAVIVDGRAADDGEHRVTVGHGRRHRLQQYCPSRAGDDRSSGRRIKGPTVPVRRKDLPFFVEVPAQLIR